MAKSIREKTSHVSVSKKTTQTTRKSTLATSNLNKSKRRSFKAYRGQGR